MLDALEYADVHKICCLPIVLFTESLIPILAAVVAAPMQKLFPAKFCSSNPIAINPSLTFLGNRSKDFSVGTVISPDRTKPGMLPTS